MDNESANPTRLSEALRWGGVGVIALIAVVRCVVAFMPQIIFDVDPAFFSDRVTGLGPAGSLMLDVALIAACGMALLGEISSGRGLRWGIFLLAIAPAPLILWHGTHDLGHLWRGSTWMAAILAGVTIAHLARDRSMKLLVAALLLALALPLLVRGAGQLTYEHTELLEEFQANKERFFRQRGWEPGSPSARIYERRLLTAEPLGWFATTNIFASVMTLCIASYLGLIIVSVKAKLPGGWTMTLGLVGAGASYALWRCGSLGGLGAASAGLMVLAAPAVGGWARRIMQRFGGGLILAGLALVVLAVVARGTLVGEDFAGDRSLLFRWHYLVGATGIVGESPLTGVGPDGFQEAYTRHRPPRNPEEVMSAHSLFVDWISCLGVAGLAWVGVVGLLVWRAKDALSESRADNATDQYSGLRAVTIAASSIAVLGLGAGLLIEFRVSPDPLIPLLRGLGALGFVALAMITARVMIRSETRLVDWALVAGAAGLLVHAQVEMTLVRPGAVVWAMAILGTACPLREGGTRKFDTLAPVMLIALAAWIAMTGAIPAARQEATMQDAASLLKAFPRDTPSRVALRRRVSARLVEAHAQLPTHAHPAQRAAQQLMFAAGRVEGAARVDLLRDAVAILDAPNTPQRTFTISLRAGMLQIIASTTGHDADWRAAMSEGQKLVLRDPRGNSIWLRYADCLWESGREQAAGRAYRQALEADDAFELDPFKQFAESDRTRAETRASEPVEVPGFQFSVPDIR